MTRRRSQYRVRSYTRLVIDEAGERGSGGRRVRVVQTGAQCDRSPHECRRPTKPLDISEALLHWIERSGDEVDLDRNVVANESRIVLAAVVDTEIFPI
jgi:hypothetical protein